jgi:hypothetical protein
VKKSNAREDVESIGPALVPILAFLGKITVLICHQIVS